MQSLHGHILTSNRAPGEREGRALDVDNVGGEGVNRSTYTPGRSPGQGTGSGGRGGERGVVPDRLPIVWGEHRKGVNN